jgi:hypothetical protein
MLFKRAIVRATVNLFIIAALVVVSIVGSNSHLSGPKRAAAQDVTVVVEGPLQSINNNIWVVSNQSIEITTTTSVSGAPVIGSTVRIVAIQKANGKLVATSVTITITTSPANTPAAATAPATPISTAPATQAVTPAATMRSFPGNFPYVKIIIEGPVEAVDLTVNVIVVYKQRIRLRANDPIRSKIKKGDWVRCDGNMERDADNRIIIVVINIIIINPPPVVIVVQPGNSNPGGGSGGNNGGGRRDDDDDDD